MNTLGPLPLIFSGDFPSQHIWKSTITQKFKLTFIKNILSPHNINCLTSANIVILRMGVTLVKLYSFDELVALMFLSSNMIMKNHSW